MKSIVSKFSIFVALGAFVAFAVVASAQGLYKWIDKDGRVTYSDVPAPKDARKVETKRLGNNVIEADTMPFELKKVVAANPITLYGNDCDPCVAARAFLNKRGVPFSDKNIDRDPDARKMLAETIKSQTVPTLTIGATSKKGFEEGDWNAAITEAGYPKDIPKSVLRNAQPKPEPVKEAAKPKAEADAAK